MCDAFINSENLKTDEDNLENIDYEDFSKSSDSELWVNSEKIL